MITAPIFMPAMGLATPLGTGRDAVARALFAGSRGGLVARDNLVAGRRLFVGAVTDELPTVPADLADLDCRNNRLFQLALDQIADAVAAATAQYGPHRVGVILGTSTAGIAEAEAAFTARAADGTWPASFHYRQQEGGGLSDYAARRLGLAGPAYTIATACSSSGKVFASGRRLIRAGICDAVVVGGADTLCKMTAGGFSALGAMSPGLCNPFSRNRDGINIGEAAAAFLLTRDEAPIRLLGLGETSDAHHISAPHPEGRGAWQAMHLALKDAGLDPRDIAYVNLHGTGTALNDSAEGRAVDRLFGPDVACSSTKAMTGHTLGAAGACEAAFLWLALDAIANPGSLLPPHLWDGEADPDIPPLRLTAAGDGFGAGPAAMLSNSFAFGGSNVAVVLGRD